MTHIVYGNRLGKQAELRLGCSAILFDESRSKVLLTLRKDNGLWCLPGGMIDPGESVTEGCLREVMEETGLQVRLLRLSGVYSDPHQVVVYPDGNQAHVVVLGFEVEFLGGELGLSAETAGVDWFPVDKALQMDLFHGHAQHVRDALAMRPAAFIR